MESNRAAEHLQVIRTLMERSAIYRRALVPIMLYVGALGSVAGLAGPALGLRSMSGFGLYWIGVALVAVTGAFVLARRQALRDREPFWSPPARRMTQALLPAFVSGGSLAGVLCTSDDESLVPLFVLLAAFFYGSAVHAAGFFMPRGMKWFGWTIIVTALALLLVALKLDFEIPARTGHWLMGFIFGGLHLAYGVYLKLTQQTDHAA